MQGLIACIGGMLISSASGVELVCLAGRRWHVRYAADLADVGCRGREGLVKGPCVVQVCRKLGAV